MKIERQIEELAKLDGSYEGCCHVHVRKGMPAIGHGLEGVNKELPDYDSHDALQPIIDGMGWGDIEEVGAYLLEILGVPQNALKCVILRHSLKATTAQKREAILKAYGKWEES